MATLSVCVTSILLLAGCGQGQANFKGEYVAIPKLQAQEVVVLVDAADYELMVCR